jgi:hypothetical protein
MRLNVKAFALTAGILWGAAICLATLWLLAFGHEGEAIRLLDHFYLGYTYSVGGAFVGLVWGFLDGLVAGGLFAWLYNRLTK